MEDVQLCEKSAYEVSVVCTCAQETANLQGSRASSVLTPMGQLAQADDYLLLKRVTKIYIYKNKLQKTTPKLKRLTKTKTQRLAGRGALWPPLSESFTLNLIACTCGLHQGLTEHLDPVAAAPLGMECRSGSV